MYLWKQAEQRLRRRTAIVGGTVWQSAHKDVVVVVGIVRECVWRGNVFAEYSVHECVCIVDILSWWDWEDVVVRRGHQHD